MTHCLQSQSALTRRRLIQAVRDDESGFTLAEALVSIALFTVVAICSTVAIVNIVRVTNVSKSKVAATNLARQEIERLRLQNSTGRQLVSGPPVDTSPFVVTTTMSPAATTDCAVGSSRAITVTVSWKSDGSHAIRFDTAVAC